MQVMNLQFTHSELMMLEDNSLQYLRTTLESLSLVNAKLNEVSKEEVEFSSIFFRLLYYYSESTWEF